MERNCLHSDLHLTLYSSLSERACTQEGIRKLGSLKRTKGQLRKAQKPGLRGPDSLPTRVRRQNVKSPEGWENRRPWPTILTDEQSLAHKIMLVRLPILDNTHDTLYDHGQRKRPEIGLSNWTVASEKLGPLAIAQESTLSSSAQLAALAPPVPVVPGVYRRMRAIWSMKGEREPAALLSAFWFALSRLRMLRQ